MITLVSAVKAIVQLVMTVLAALVPALPTSPLDPAGWVNVVILTAGVVMVCNAAKLRDGFWTASSTARWG